MGGSTGGRFAIGAVAAPAGACRMSVAVLMAIKIRRHAGKSLNGT
jgi:hypothetical protein